MYTYIAIINIVMHKKNSACLSFELNNFINKMLVKTASRDNVNLKIFQICVCLLEGMS